MITRILSALILAPPVIYLILGGRPLYFFILLLPVSAGLLYEWHSLRGKISPRKWAAQTVLAWFLLFVGIYGQADLILPAIVTTLFIMVAATVLDYQPTVLVMDRWSYDFTGMIYCVLPLILLVKIKYEWGGIYLLLPFLIIWATDSGAYFSGKFLGNKKLAPQLSPGKTWVGFYGGCLSGVGTGIGISLFFSLSFFLWQAALIGMALSLVGQLGDLAESLLKRESGVKDSGKLIPGHGGLLDRLDSLLFAAPVYYGLLVAFSSIPPFNGG
ncbi:MAG: phosphatidate cytidylyltransferase [Magnetococcales bacterium]|nr:phosphatidate cytidylyltransferase [Magnetococcales bacterium]